MAEMIKVESKAVEAIGYDSARGDLLVLLTTGRAYAYHSVPDGFIDEFLAAESKGEFYNYVVKIRFPDYTELDPVTFK